MVEQSREIEAIGKDHKDQIKIMSRELKTNTKLLKSTTAKYHRSITRIKTLQREKGRAA